MTPYDMTTNTWCLICEDILQSMTDVIEPFCELPNLEAETTARRMCVSI